MFLRRVPGRRKRACSIETGWVTLPAETEIAGMEPRHLSSPTERTRPKIRGALARMLDEAEAEMRAEFIAEEEAKRQRRAAVARANLVRAR
jgi:hypothetical protein